jgi:hypothetical protein
MVRLADALTEDQLRGMCEVKVRFRLSVAPWGLGCDLCASGESALSIETAREEVWRRGKNGGKSV